MSAYRRDDKYSAPTERHHPPVLPGSVHERAPLSSHAPARGYEDHSAHPLHGIYRRRMRGVRFRWFGSGLLGGVLLGILLTFLVSALVVRQFPVVLVDLSGDPDMAMVIGEPYLNRVVAARVEEMYKSGRPLLSLSSLRIDLKPDSRMDLSPSFSADLGITTLNVSAGVQNRLSIRDNKVVVEMVGNPQIGSLNVPIDFLPFDLNSQLRSAVDKVNNDLLISEINKAVDAGTTGSNLVIGGVSTTENAMTISLQQHP